MNCGCQDTNERMCGCCTGATQSTPAVVANRPGLPAISYRAGTYASFLETMFAGLSGSDVPGLAGLRTRSNADFSIALVDAWSEVLDILTFYTERLANETYLATSVEGRSLFELARLVGYKPSPGVSASTTLAFTLASAPGSPTTVPIPAGTRVQSVPGPGQQPQVFETSADLTATIAANAIPAAITVPWQLNTGDTSTWVQGNPSSLRVGSLLLFINSPGGMPTASGPAFAAYVTAVVADPPSGNTKISWDQPLSADVAALSPEVALYFFQTKASLFGAASPMPDILPASTLLTIPEAPAPTSPQKSDWTWQPVTNQAVNLDNTYQGINPPAGANPHASQLQWMVLNSGDEATLFQIQSVAESNPGLYALSAKTSQVAVSTTFTTVPVPTLPSNSNTNLSVDTSISHLLTENLSLYQIAIEVTSGSFDQIISVVRTAEQQVNDQLTDFVKKTRRTTAYIQSQMLAPADLPITDWSQSGTYPLATDMLAPVSGNTITLAQLQPLASKSPIGVSGKRVRIAPTTPRATFTPAGSLAELTVSEKQPFLVESFPPATDPASGNLLWNVLTVTGQGGTLLVAPSEFELQPSEKDDPVASEASAVSTCQIKGTTTDLTLAGALARIYDAPTVRINANAVLATHGETVQEILGSGDGSNGALQIPLKQSPLTYISSPSPTGAQSTLQVRVNNLLWTEVPNFLQSSPAEHVYITQPSSAGRVTVQFGNGANGARTPTGQSNLRALYRKGIGLAGMVAAGQLTQPLDRPQGLQSVTNPSPASGGADPSTPADARRSAPLPTLTLGRVVSLEDYQNFTLAFPGISFALATWTWFGSTRGVFLTIAGASGKTLDPKDQIVQNLSQALQNNGLPNLPLVVVSYVPALFEIGLQVRVDTPTYDPDLVLAQVWQSLAAAFSFGRLAPGQGVAASEVIRIAQNVPGVVAINLTGLNRSGAPSGPSDFLSASGPHPEKTPPLGAEILKIDPASQGNIEVWS